jgi:ribosomal protein S18 acetylase RimI-like enzyme
MLSQNEGNKARMRIRFAERLDAPVIIEFNRRMARETENKELPLDVISAGVNSIFEDAQKGFYVVAEDYLGEVVGCLLITFEWSDWRNGWFWWIQSVYVRADARGRGVYRKLYEWVLTESNRARNVCGIRLYVEKENHAAQAVYQKLGMTETDYLMYETIFKPR